MVFCSEPIDTEIHSKNEATEWVVRTKAANYEEERDVQKEGGKKRRRRNTIVWGQSLEIIAQIATQPSADVAPGQASF